MGCDTDYQASPSVPPPRPRIETQLAGLPQLAAADSQIWTSDQLYCLLVQMVSIPLLFIGLSFFKHDYMSILWTNARGVCLLIFAVMLTASSGGWYLVLCAMLVLAARDPHHSDWPGVSRNNYSIRPILNDDRLLALLRSPIRPRDTCAEPRRGSTAE
jgi:hypothetical protein